MSQAKLSGRVALVSGASRGAGLGIATELALVGAKVHLTGRTGRGGPNPSGHPGTIEEAAEGIQALGGQAQAWVVDHREPDQVARLIAAIEAEDGPLDLVVNNAWGGHDPMPGDPTDMNLAPPWAQDPLPDWERMFHNGVRNALILNRHALPGMVARGRGLVVHTCAWDEDHYTRLHHYDLAKQAIIRLAYTLGLELKPHGLTSLAVAAGWMRTELVLKAFQATEATWTEEPELAGTESPRYLGRAIAALAADEGVGRWMGKQPLRVGELARHYGFTDHDGRQPEVWRMPADMLWD